MYKNAYEKKRVSLKGSATIEMAYLMPMFLVLFFLLVTLTFYFHDKCVLYATAYETAVIGAQKERIPNAYSEEELVDYFQERSLKKLIFFSDVNATVEKGLEYFQVDVTASKNGWKIHAEEKAMIMRTEELIYLKGQLEGGEEDE